MENIFRVIGWKLMNLRQGKRLTQVEMAEKIGLSIYQISRMERGHGDTTLKNISQACDFFEIEMEELFHREEKVEIDMNLRPEHFEKDPQHRNSKNYSKGLLSNVAKIKVFDVPYRTVRKLRIEHDAHYEVFALKGTASISCRTDSITMKPEQIVSIKGEGMVRLLNLYEEPAKVIFFIY